MGSKGNFKIINQAPSGADKNINFAMGQNKAGHRTGQENESAKQVFKDHSCWPMGMQSCPWHLLKGTV